MDIKHIQPGVYVVAVSGGVDSTALLHMLMQKYSTQQYTFIVAHFDHGMRADSKADSIFVESLAQNYGLTFEYAEGVLGSNASEDAARKARYAFLRSVAKKHEAKAIILAHHKNDALETICINVLRGTGRRGLSSLKSWPDGSVIRPMLHMDRQAIEAYAKQHNVKWREDPTNADIKYLRNWVRRVVIPRLSDQQKRQLEAVHSTSLVVNKEIDSILKEVIGGADSGIVVEDLVSLPHALATEYVAYWLRMHKAKDVDKKIINRIVIGLKTLPEGKKIPITQGKYVIITKGKATVAP